MSNKFGDISCAILSIIQHSSSSQPTQRREKNAKRKSLKTSEVALNLCFQGHFSFVVVDCEQSIRKIKREHLRVKSITPKQQQQQ